VGWAQQVLTIFSCDKDFATYFTSGRLPDKHWLGMEWVLTTSNAVGFNSLTCYLKHGGARDNKFWESIAGRKRDRGAIELLNQFYVDTFRNVLKSSMAPRQSARCAIPEAKQRSQLSVTVWVTKIYYFEHLRASEGTVSCWSRLDLQTLAPTPVSRRVDVRQAAGRKNT
jgi:hypothetical protein